MIRWVWVIEILFAMGAAIWVSGTSDPSWVRMLIVGILISNVMIMMAHLLTNLLASDKKD